jgi:hypothetical protein
MTDRLRITELDFDQIKTNLKSFLQQQTEFQDYDFEGSGLSVLLDLLAYNTHYNAYYLNMVANESFLDTALLRDSVVSHAKTLGYTPFSYTAPVATINLEVDSGNTIADELTIPKGLTFVSNLIDGVAYNFVTIEPVTVQKSNTTFYFDNLKIYQGQLVSYGYTNSLSQNPKSVFTLPDSQIDTSTITVTVSPSSSNTQTDVYSKVTDILDVTSASKVFFLQEGREGKYQIYFGDGVIGNKLPDGAIVSVTYLVTEGDIANKADNFIGATNIGPYSDYLIQVVSSAAGGATRETVDAIKQSALAQFATQNRLVTIKDYQSYILTNYPSIQSISVWGGQEESPPVYGKVYIAMQPKEGYFLSETEKQRIIDDIISPKSIVSVQTEIREPEYLFLILNNFIKYDPRKTVLTPNELRDGIRTSILQYKSQELDKFDARFVLSKVQDYIDATDLNSIIGSETTLRLQKRFTPTLNSSKNYTIKFGVPLYRGTLNNKLVSSEFDVFDNTGVRRTVNFSEVPQSFSGITSIDVTNPGTGYTTSPTVTITGDGTGAEAEAIIVNGRIESINVTKRGINYTKANLTISGGSGFGATASAKLDGRFGQIEVIYFDENAEKQIVFSNAGTIDYDLGVITVSNIIILSVVSDDEQIRFSVESEKGIVESTKNTIITLDVNDPSAITVDLEVI